ncbi:calcium-binding protein [Cribrihabitans sp. XS_ASV171]
MLMIAGLLGLAAVGGIVFMSDEIGGEQEDSDLAPVEPEAVASDDPPADLLDFAEASESDPASLQMGAVNGVSDTAAADEVEEFTQQSAYGPVGVVSEFDGNLVIAGGEDADNLSGAAGDDQINGYEGNDDLSGAGGNDTMRGEDGDDTVRGGAGADEIDGDAGADQLSGEDGDDRLRGHDGDDRMDGDGGNDTLEAGFGDDRLFGGSGDDALHGWHGDDSLDGGDGMDSLFGGFGNDFLIGSEDTNDQDFLNGGSGLDTIVAGAGDVVTGGADADTIVLGDWLAQAESAKVMDFQSGEDSLLVLWDLARTPDPEITLEEDPDRPGLFHLSVEGEHVAELRADAVAPGDIVLMDIADFDGMRLAG